MSHKTQKSNLHTVRNNKGGANIEKNYLIDSFPCGGGLGTDRRSASGQG